MDMKTHAEGTGFTSIFGKITAAVLIITGLTTGCTVPTSAPPTTSASAWIDVKSDGVREVYYKQGDQSILAGRLTTPPPPRPTEPRPPTLSPGCCVWTPMGCIC